ncbi:hypothetical protein JL720_16908 [Aureococcus anophagefferens]|nr:hypothetical protein JL720_16908 [Aureococcus anophagefferens]
MAGAVAAPPNPERARTKSDEGVMSWLTGNAPGEPHDDKENEGHTFADTVDAIRTEKGPPHAIPSWDRGRPSMYGAAPAHVMRSHEEMSPKKRGWWGGVRDVMKGGQRSIDTIKLAKNMGDEQKKYKERSKRELDAWEEKYKFDKDTDEAKDAREEIEKKNKRHFVHMAEMFRDLALTNGGFQVKLCQMLAMNTALFPEDVRPPLRECCEKAWNVPLATILPNIEGKKRGLGRRYQEVFETLEPEAMAARPSRRSTARRRRPRRQQVLVKVQHVGVRDALRADVAILPYLIQFVDNLDPNHGLRPLMYMISSMLEQEVDFRIEGANRERLAAIVERSGKSERSRYSTLYFPLVMWDYCVESMMVQEFMEGAALARRLVKVDNYAALAVGACYVGALAAALSAVALLLGLVAPFLAARAAAACPPLGAALYGFGAFVRHAKNAVTAAVGGAAGLACFFLGEHFAEVDFGAELKRNLKSMFKDPKMVARLEQAFTFHQQTRSKVDKAIAETADVRFELIIIDHGFHTHVTYEYRLAWCKVWAGIGLCDEELLKEGCADFGLEGDDYKKMTMILSFFPYPVWRERRFCGLSEFLGYLKSGNEHGLVATQEVTNRKLPKQFHLMHRTSQQIAAHFNAEYGMGYESSYHFLEHMTKYALLGLRFRNRAAAEFPNASVDKDSNIWALFAKDEAEKWKKWIADDAEKHAQLAMDARRVSLGMSEDDFKAKVAEESGGAAIYVPPAPEEAPDKGETADGDDDKQKRGAATPALPFPTTHRESAV